MRKEKLQYDEMREQKSEPIKKYNKKAIQKSTKENQFELDTKEKEKEDMQDNTSKENYIFEVPKKNRK